MKYRILVPAILLKNNTMAKFGEEIEGDRFAEPVAQRIKENFIEEVKEKPLTAAEKKKLKDEDDEAVRLENERIQKEKDDAALETERLRIEQEGKDLEAEKQRSQMNKVSPDTDQDMMDHVVTDEDLLANSDLGKNGVKVGDTIQIPKVSDVDGKPDPAVDQLKSAKDDDKKSSANTTTQNPLDKLKSGK